MQDILTCEGDCGCTVHRYCAGVTKGHFERLSKSSTPYVYEWCSLKTTQAIIQQLQSEIASLKLELAEAKALAVRSSTMPQTTSSTYAAAASHPPRSTGVTHSTTSTRGRRAQRQPMFLRLGILQLTGVDVQTEFQYVEYGIHTSTHLPNLLKMQSYDSAR